MRKLFAAAAAALVFTVTVAPVAGAADDVPVAACTPRPDKPCPPTPPTYPECLTLLDAYGDALNQFHSDTIILQLQRDQALTDLAAARVQIEQLNGTVRRLDRTLDRRFDRITRLLERIDKLRDAQRAS